MRYVMFLLLLSCNGAMKQPIQTKQKVCGRIAVYQGNLPTCSFVPMKEVVFKGYTREDLYQTIQTEVCKLGGHGVLVKSRDFTGANIVLTGTVIRCNVPFLLPSDLSERN